MFFQGFDKSLGTPQKHSAVPEITARSNELSGSFGIRLFREAAYMQCVALKQSPRLNVAVASLRPVWPDAEHHDVRAGRGDLNSTLQRLAKAVLTRNYMIGGKHANDRVGILPQKKKRRQSDGWSGISSNWLREQLRLGQLRKLPRDGGSQIFIRNDPELLRGSQWQ